METSASPGTRPIPILSSITGLATGREAWLTDIWGVMHNGVEPFAAASDACTRFRLSGGTVLLLSNAPRPAESVAAQLDRIGVPRFAWDAILTSGDAARALVGAYAGKPVFALGPERDLSLYDGLGITLSDAGDAEAISCTGLFDDEIETPDDYAELLAGFAARNLPMVCANPDLTVERGSKIIYCAGALASAYEKLGGRVAYAGKPYLPVYDMALALIEKVKGKAVPREKILAIGDGIRTDIEGAATAGIDSVFVASGVHAPSGLTSEILTELFPDPAIRPIAAMPSLVW
ncbi:TIGR01459 family HAD-type hydrolase [Hyphomicrobium sp. LHD-15]|uniref:TIGR01459 family HAD-type hydrolase n=1 Tax=Hyphomicrobium sp. LHD-15 TaxID=3072142 RepID=UPI00280EC3B4|nr:TIGR01459 family HAD-type hydrolase [Hyphomicrobium sp. LHD-15]MDQ8700012.1 TIGR01459 family HAD-type hydrolase [Hyphomicrobium sp. LHD-15]